jgi:transposase
LDIQNKTIIADNVSFHKSKEVITYLKNNKANMIFIPPYSPEYNPIEFVFSEIKRKIRIINFDSSNKLYEYLKDNLKIVSSNLTNYFKHSLKNLI